MAQLKGRKDDRATEIFVIGHITNRDTIMAMQRMVGQAFAHFQDECEPIFQQDLKIYGRQGVYITLWMTEEEHHARVRILREQMAILDEYDAKIKTLRQMEALENLERPANLN